MRADRVIGTDGNVYVCYDTHTAADGFNHPIVDGFYADVWRLTTDGTGVQTWTNGTLYVTSSTPETIQQGWRDDYAAIFGDVEREHGQFLAGAQAFAGPPRLLGLSTKRAFLAVFFANDELPPKPEEIETGAPSLFFQSYFFLRRGAQVAPLNEAAPENEDASHLWDAFFFNSWVHIKVRPALILATDAYCSSAVAIDDAQDDLDETFMLSAPAFVSGKVPKFGDKTITPELSFLVAGV